MTARSIYGYISFQLNKAVQRPAKKCYVCHTSLPNNADGWGRTFKYIPRNHIARSSPAWFNLAPTRPFGKCTPGNNLHVYTTSVTPLLTRATAAWLVRNGGIATSCGRCFAYASSEISSHVNQLLREPHVCHRVVHMSINYGVSRMGVIG